jgi:hypothetical protein
MRTRRSTRSETPSGTGRMGRAVYELMSAVAMLTLALTGGVRR